MPSIYNGFPLIYYDSGYYLLFGLYDVEPWLVVWRPIIYGLITGQFLKWGGHLDQLIVLQNVFISTLLLFFCKNLMGKYYRHWIFIIVLAGTFLTPLPWVSNFLLPDIFSGLVPLFISALLVQEQFRTRLLMGIGALGSLTMHHSNMITSVFLLPILWLKYRSKILSRAILVVLVLPWILIPIIHGSKTQSYTVSNAGHAILFSRLMAFGVAQEYLSEVCREQNVQNSLCRYTYSEFDLWNWANSTYESRSLEEFKRQVEEFRSVNIDILTGKYFFIYLAKALDNSLKQIFSNSQLLEAPQNSGLIESEFSRLGFENYNKFKNQRLPAGPPSAWKRIMESTFNLTVFSSVFLLLFFLLSGRLSQRMQTYFTVCLLFYVLNGLTIGLFTEPMPRYSIRISWVFFFLLLIQFGIQLKKLCSESSKTKEI